MKTIEISKKEIHEALVFYMECKDLTANMVLLATKRGQFYFDQVNGRRAGVDIVVLNKEELLGDKSMKQAFKVVLDQMNLCYSDKYVLVDAILSRKADMGGIGTRCPPLFGFIYATDLIKINN